MHEASAEICTLPDGRLGGRILFPYTKPITLPLSDFEVECTSIEDKPDPNILAFLKRSKPQHLLPFDWSCVPPGTKERLMPHQRSSVEDVVTLYDGRILLGYEQGTGKTAPGCVIPEQYGGPTLYLVPGNKRNDWKKEKFEWTGKTIQIIRKGSEPITCDQVIVSFDLAWKHPEILATKWRCIVVDEAHKLKSEKAKRAILLLPLLHRARCLLLLTGTPQEQKPSELFNLLSALYPQVFTSRKAYTKRYCEGHFNEWQQWVEDGAKHLDELKIILAQVMIRVKKATVLPELPPKHRVMVNIPTEEEDLCTFRKEHAKFRTFMSQKEAATQAQVKKRIGDQIKTQCTLLWRMTELAKIKVAKSWIVKEILAHPEDKFILFCVHLEAVKELCDYLKEKSLEHVCITGDVLMNKRDAVIQPFMDAHNRTVRIAVMTIECGGTGLNFTVANRIVFVGIARKPGLMEQAEDRAHRKGATKPVTCYWLYGEGLYDYKVFNALRFKSKNNNHVVDGKEEISLTFQQKIRGTGGGIQKKQKLDDSSQV
jgi:SWI/SNF-related matrix-associated actin-dependent regulator 1 of chromatin subfamily A